MDYSKEVPSEVELHTHWHGILPAKEFIQFISNLNQIEDPIPYIKNVIHEFLGYIVDVNDAAQMLISTISSKSPYDFIISVLDHHKSNPKVTFDMVYLLRGHVWNKIVGVAKQREEEFRGKQEYSFADLVERLKSITVKDDIRIYDGYSLVEEHTSTTFEKLLEEYKEINDINFFVQMDSSKDSWNRMYPSNKNPSVADYIHLNDKIKPWFSAECLEYFYFCKCLDGVYKSHSKGVAYAEIQGSLPAKVPPKLFVRRMKEIGCIAMSLTSLEHHWFAKETQREFVEEYTRKISNLEYELSIGIDVSGPEKMYFKEEKLYNMLYYAMTKMEKLHDKTKLKYVVRIHTGEGYTKEDKISESEISRARENVSTTFKALDKIYSERPYWFGKCVEVRLGHLTHIGSDHYEKLARMNCIMEINLISNERNCVCEDGDRMHTHFIRNILFDLVHTRARRCRTHMDTVHGTDGGGCYGFNLDNELARVEEVAKKMVDRDGVYIGKLDRYNDEAARKMNTLRFCGDKIALNGNRHEVQSCCPEATMNNIMKFSYETIRKNKLKQCKMWFERL